MSKLPDARRMLEEAERAASSGEFSSAADLLNAAARIQEAELGPLHSELALTLNSLAIVAERTGRFADAETFFRRSATIAAASLPADHSIVIESRKNLEDFCRERGLPNVAPVDPNPPAQETAGVVIKPPSPTPRVAKPTTSQVLPPVPPTSTRQIRWVPIGAIVLVAIVFVPVRRFLSRSASTTPSPSHVAESALPPPAASLPIEPTPTEATPVPVQVATQSVQAVAPPSAVTISGDVNLAAAELCLTLSTSGGQWQCVPAGDSVSPGARVFYTRVRSAGDTTVVHRWYREDVLRQAVSLTIRANASEGYRTYSRHTVDVVGDWRVEIRNTRGDLLHEQRFAVR